MLPWEYILTCPKCGLSMIRDLWFDCEIIYVIEHLTNWYHVLHPINAEPFVITTEVLPGGHGLTELKP